jgi:catechol 2,3-dioxygenase-like lactoylglutathione lyase family enzyme
VVECSCCGEQRDPSMTAALLCHDDIKLCRICLGWLMARAGGLDVTPTLPVRDMEEATRFWQAAGFDVDHYSDDFAFVQYRDRSVFDLDRIAGLDPATNHAGCYIVTEQTDEWHARFVAAGLAVTPVEDMPWSMHEFTLTDTSGNRIRIGRSVAA